MYSTIDFDPPTVCSNCLQLFLLKGEGIAWQYSTVQYETVGCRFSCELEVGIFESRCLLSK